MKIIKNTKLATRIEDMKLCKTLIPNPSQGDFGFKSETIFFISVVWLSKNSFFAFQLLDIPFHSSNH